MFHHDVKAPPVGGTGCAPTGRGQVAWPIRLVQYHVRALTSAQPAARSSRGCSTASIGTGGTITGVGQVLKEKKLLKDSFSKYNEEIQTGETDPRQYFKLEN